MFIIHTHNNIKVHFFSHITLNTKHKIITVTNFNFATHFKRFSWKAKYYYVTIRAK